MIEPGFIPHTFTTVGGFRGLHREVKVIKKFQAPQRGYSMALGDCRQHEFYARVFRFSIAPATQRFLYTADVSRFFLLCRGEEVICGTVLYSLLAGLTFL